MAYRHQNRHDTHDRVPSYYANNKLYPDSYTRNEWQTRSSRRLHEGLSLPTNFGLDTVSDDVNSSPFSSPYYINGRHNSQNISIQRGNAASVQGIKRLLSVGDIERDFTSSQQDTSLELWQGKQIKFKLPYTGKIIGNTISIKNTDGCTGILSIYLSSSESDKPIYETAVDLCAISTDKFEHVKLYSATPFLRDSNPRGEVFVRMEIWNEISEERSANPFNTGRKIEIAATANGNHSACTYVLGDKNKPVKENYDYHRYPSQPLLGLIYNNYESIPVSRHEDQDMGAAVSLNGYRYGLFAYRTETNARMFVYDYVMNRLVEQNGAPVEYPIDGRAKEINLVQGFDYVYYADGFSPLRRFKIGKWNDLYEFPASKYEDVKVAIKLDTFQASDLGKETGIYSFIYSQEDNKWKYKDKTVSLDTYGLSLTGIPADSGVITVNYTAAGQTTKADISAEYADARPVIAPSIICKHNNRIYLAGFHNDPNLIQCSEIKAEGPDYSSYPYRFYAPDNSPLATSTNTVTAIVPYASDNLMIISKNSFSIFTSNVNIEDGVPTQISSFIDGGGVRSSGDVTNYGGVVYSFDADEGIRRFTGATWNKIPASVDSLFERVDMNKSRKLWGYAHRLYFNYTDKVDSKQKCLVWDMDMNYQQFPWFQDVDIPFCDVRHDDDFDITGIHSDYPCIMQLYAPNTWRRLDSPITFERHTKYLSLPGNSDDMIVSRIHNKVLANANRWWWFSLTADADSMEQVRGRNAWYRMPCWDTLEKVGNPEDPFFDQDQYESDAVARLTIGNVRIRGISVQEKIKAKTFREQASLISILLEARPRQYN